MSQRNLRACMVCSIVQPYSKFMRDGCPNCEDILELRGNSDAVGENTSQVFEGLIAIQQPQESWVAKWQRVQDYVPGVYAVKVEGILPEDVIAQMESLGLRYVPRDGSGTEEPIR